MVRRLSTMLLPLAIGACAAAPADVTTTQPDVSTTVASATTAVLTTTTAALSAEEQFLAGLTEWGGTDEAKLTVGEAICDAMTAGTTPSTIFETLVAVSEVDPDELIVIGQQAITTLCPAHRLNGGWDALEVEAQRPSTTTAPESSLTVSQRNAIATAQSYLEVSSFSRTGLIAQLEYEQFSTADATFAVDSLEVDWNEQAALSAKSYLEVSSFSRGGLIDQLVYEGFTIEQATYGVTAAGL